jgi:hypothetical protein
VWLSGSWAWDRDAERQEQTAALGYEVNTLDPAGPWLRSTQEHDARAGALLKDPEALEAASRRALADPSPRGVDRALLLLEAQTESIVSARPNTFGTRPVQMGPAR